MRQLNHNQDCAGSNVCGINNPELDTIEKKQYAEDLKQNIAEIEELIKCIKYLQPKPRKKAITKAQFITVRRYGLIIYGFKKTKQMEFTKQEKSALEWLFIKGMEITNSDKKYEVFDKMYERLVNNLPISGQV